MAFLLQARFNASGPTNTDIINLGGVSFDHDSRIHDGNKCAFFEPSNDNAALQIIGTTRDKVSRLVGTNKSEYTIYFKFCIDLRDRIIKEPIPIFSYVNRTTGKPLEWITIVDNEYFKFSIDDEISYRTKPCTWVFDNNWHTFTLSKGKYVTELFLDGIIFSTLSIPETPVIKNTPSIFIGRRAEEGTVDHFYTIPGGYLDDICIIDNIVYTQYFIPPNKYFKGADIIENYHWGLENDMSYMPRDLIEYTDKRMESTAFRINEKQKEWLPRRLRIQWHEEEYLWDYKNYWKVTKSRDYTAISIWGLEQPLLMDPWNDEFVDIFNCFYAWEEDKLYPFMLFIDRRFIPLSRIYILKSGQYYTLFIKDRIPDKYDGRIERVDLVHIPFRCIYEENEPKRMDIEPLYSFNKDGLFDIHYAVYFYYLDKERSPDMNCLPIQDDDGDSYVTINESLIMHSIWRYGHFQQISSTSTHVIVKFVCTDMTYQADVDVTVNLYRNKVQIPKDVYDVIGPDTFRFIYASPYGKEGLFNKTISMQLVSEVKPPDPVITGITDMKHVTIHATEPNQCTFKIPELVDDDGFVYKHCLVFRNSVCMNAKNRFKLTHNKKCITFQNPIDIINEGDPLTFVFLKTLKADQFGPLYINAKYLYSSVKSGGGTPTVNDTTYDIDIPPFRNMRYTTDNVFFFLNGTLVTPDRYTITNNTVHMKKSAVMYYKNDLEREHREIVFVLLILGNKYEEAIYETRKYQHDQGARFILYDLLIDKHVKITLDNFVLFDTNGEYMPSFTGEVYNLNIIKSLRSNINPFKYIPRYLTCVWSKKRSLPNEANIVIPEGTLFMKDYTRLYMEFFEMDHDFNLFMKDFNVYYHRNIHYGQNLQNAFLYMISYNQLKFIDLYKKRSKMQRLDLNVKRLNDRIASSGIMGPICMDRSLYKDPAHRTFCMFFENGKIPKWHKDITYSLNQLYIRFPKYFDAKDKVEVFKFHDLNNTLVKLDAKIL